MPASGAPTRRMLAHSLGCGPETTPRLAGSPSATSYASIRPSMAPVRASAVAAVDIVCPSAPRTSRPFGLTRTAAGAADFETAHALLEEEAQVLFRLCDSTGHGEFKRTDFVSLMDAEGDELAA